MNYLVCSRPFDEQLSKQCLSKPIFKFSNLLYMFQDVIFPFQAKAVLHEKIRSLIWLFWKQSFAYIWLSWEWKYMLMPQAHQLAYFLTMATQHHYFYVHQLILIQVVQCSSNAAECCFFGWQKILLEIILSCSPPFLANDGFEVVLVALP